MEFGQNFQYIPAVITQAGVVLGNTFAIKANLHFFELKLKKDEYKSSFF
jgi:hypothetical protein